MNVESTRLVDHRSLPNTRPARWNQTTSNMRAAAPDEKKITPIENSTGMRSVTWFRCLIVQRGDPMATCRPFLGSKEPRRQRSQPCNHLRLHAWTRSITAVVSDGGRCDVRHRIQHGFVERLDLGEAELALDVAVRLARDAVRRQQIRVEVLRLRHQ